MGAALSGPSDRTLVFRLERLGDGLGTAWRNLEARSDATFFLSWHWIAAWLAEIETAPLVLSATDGGCVVLLGLLTRTSRRELGVFRVYGARLQETGDPAVDLVAVEYNGFLVSREWQGLAERAAVAFVLSDTSCGPIHELHVRGAPEWYESWLRGQGLLSVPARNPTFRVDLASVRSSGQPYLAHLSANTRQQVRRAFRLYEQRGELRLTRARDVSEALGYFAALKTLHQRYWEGRGERGAFAAPFFEAMHRRAIESGIPPRCVELVQVTCGADPIGYLYNFVYRGHVFAYQSGFSFEADAKLKPGLVSHCLCIESHVACESDVYDFLAGDAQYKASLGQRGPDMLYLLLQRPAASIRFANALRRAVRRLARQPSA